MDVSFSKPCNSSILSLRWPRRAEVVPTDEHKDIGDTWHDGKGNVLW
jgi:hypothetical protein